VSPFPVIRRVDPQPIYEDVSSCRIHIRLQKLKHMEVWGDGRVETQPRRADITCSALAGLGQFRPFLSGRIAYDIPDGACGAAVAEEYAVARR
jgi:hypothetical protein